MNFEPRPLIELSQAELFFYVVELEEEIRKYRVKCHKHRVHIHQLENKMLIERARKNG
jgi:hypothetical protein